MRAKIEAEPLKPNSREMSFKKREAFRVRSSRQSLRATFDETIQSSVSYLILLSPIATRRTIPQHQRQYRIEERGP